MATSSDGPDLDRILAVIREEAKRRGASGRLGHTALDEAQERGGIARRPALVGTPRHVRDFLAMSTEQLIDVAYRHLLRRPPDASGVENFRHALRTGRRTKIEVLGLIRYSGEGRGHAVPVRGLAPAFALSILYRIPVIGLIAAGAAALLRLPPSMLDRTTFERGVQETAAELEG
jgi:O-antigen chain-terminating methyltransferase